MSLKSVLSLFVCLIALAVPSEGQARLGLAVGIEHLVCTQTRWGRATLGRLPDREFEIGVITDGKTSRIGAVGDIPYGSLTKGNSYLSLLNISPEESAVYKYEFVPTFSAAEAAKYQLNSSDYAEYNRKLYDKSPKFSLRLGRDTCARLDRYLAEGDEPSVKHARQNGEQELPSDPIRSDEALGGHGRPTGRDRAVMQASLEDYLLAYKIPHKRIWLCRFSIDDPYAVALVYGKKANPAIYTITLYTFPEDQKQLSQIDRGYFGIVTADDIPAKLAIKQCNNSTEWRLQQIRADWKQSAR